MTVIKIVNTAAESTGAYLTCKWEILTVYASPLTFLFYYHKLLIMQNKRNFKWTLQNK